jgi:CRP/FNR family cyclic AMP-dependent transcriptional regulator
MSIDIERRFSHEHIEEYEDGEIIFKEGDDGRELYIIQEGCVQIRKQSAVGELVLIQFERGDFFGDMALLQSIPRFASAYSKGKSKILILQPGGFLLKIRRDPTFAFEMLQQLSARVKLSSEKFIEAVSSGQMTNNKAQEILNSIEASSAHESDEIVKK